MKLLSIAQSDNFCLPLNNFLKKAMVKEAIATKKNLPKQAFLLFDLGVDSPLIPIQLIKSTPVRILRFQIDPHLGSEKYYENKSLEKINTMKIDTLR